MFLFAILCPLYAIKQEVPHEKGAWNFIRVIYFMLV